MLRSVFFVRFIFRRHSWKNMLEIHRSDCRVWSRLLFTFDFRFFVVFVIDNLWPRSLNRLTAQMSRRFSICVSFLRFAPSMKWFRRRYILSGWIGDTIFLVREMAHISFTLLCVAANVAAASVEAIRYESSSLAFLVVSFFSITKSINCMIIESRSIAMAAATCTQF